jgi:Glycoside-hydrolase family GH114
MARAGGKVGLAMAVAVAAACGGGGGPGGPVEPAGPVNPGGVALPAANATFDYQIGGAYTPAAGVAIVDRDRSDAPVAGKYNVCYVNAFQTQPEDFTWWTTQHPDLLLQKNGQWVKDPEWNEVVLDVSTPARRTALLGIVGPWIDACAAAGFQAIEPDNLNSWERSQGLLTMDEDIAMATLLAARAHADGLAIAQKNTSEIAPYHAQIGFDFAIVEECQPYGDCGPFDDAYGDRWFEIEYPDDGGLGNFQAACEARGARIGVIYRDRDVVPAGDPAYVYEGC